MWFRKFVSQFTADPSCILTSTTKHIQHPCHSGHVAYISADSSNFPYHLLLPYGITVTYIHDTKSFAVLKSFLALFKSLSSRPSCPLIHILCHDADWRAEVQHLVSSAKGHFSEICPLDYNSHVPHSTSASLAQTTRYGVLIYTVDRTMKETPFFQHSSGPLTNVLDDSSTDGQTFMDPDSIDLWRQTVDPSFYSKLFAHFTPLPHIVDTLWGLPTSALSQRAMSELEIIFSHHVLILGHAASAAVVSAGCWKLCSTLIVASDKEYDQFVHQFRSADDCTLQVQTQLYSWLI